MEEQTFLTYLLVFCSILVPYIAASLWFAETDVQKPSGKDHLPVFYRISGRFLSAISFALGPSFETLHSARMNRYHKMILLSGWNLTPMQMYSGQLFASFSAGFTICFFIFLLNAKGGAAIAYGLVGAVLGWFYPTMIVKRRGQDRQTEIIKSLPFAIDLLTSAMRSGLDFVAAVRYYVTMGGGGALAVEFGLLLRQMELGKSRMEALEEMSTHVQTQEFTAFVGAVAHGTEIGASIIDTLQIHIFAVILHSEFTGVGFSFLRLQSAHTDYLSIQERCRLLG